MVFFSYSGFTPLHAAAANGNGIICQLITENVEDKNPVDDTGRTPKQLWKEAAERIQNALLLVPKKANFDLKIALMQETKQERYIHNFFSQCPPKP